jgi:autotransporter-associated beta strand protein
VLGKLTGDGTLDAEAGTLSLSGGGTTAGTVDVASGATLDVDGGTFILAKGATVADAGTLELSGGTLDAEAAVSVPNLTVDGGTLDGTADVSVSGALGWTGGTMAGTGRTVVAKGGSFSFGTAGGYGYETLERELDLAGTGTLTGGALYLGGYDSTAQAYVGGTLAIQAGGSLSVDDTANIYDESNGKGQVSNAGTLTKTGTGTTTVNAALTNTGTIDVKAGTLSVLGNETNSGSITVDAGATLNLQQGLAGNGTVALGGSGASADVYGAASDSFVFSGSGASTLRLEQAEEFSGSVSGFVAGDILDFADVIAGSATLSYVHGQNGGLLTVSDGSHRHLHVWVVQRQQLPVKLRPEQWHLPQAQILKGDCVDCPKWNAGASRV